MPVVGRSDLIGFDAWSQNPAPTGDTRHHGSARANDFIAGHERLTASLVGAYDLVLVVGHGLLYVNLLRRLPTFEAFSSPSADILPVSATTGMREILGFCLSIAVVLTPSTSGRSKSIKIRSGDSASTHAMASLLLELL